MMSIDWNQTWQTPSSTPSLTDLTHSFSPSSTLDLLPSPTTPTRNQSVFRIKITVLSLMLIIILLGNTLVLTALILRRKKLSRMYFFILHLCIADIIVAFFHVLPQLCWDVTHRFEGNDFLCKVTKFGQLLGPYLSAYVLVAMALDRYMAICFPLNCLVATRSKAMIGVAWLLAIVFSSPQLFLFNYVYLEQQQMWNCWVDFTPQEQRIYVTWFIVVCTLVPLAFLSYTYGAICRAVWKNFRYKKNEGNGVQSELASPMQPQIVLNGSCRWNKGAIRPDCSSSANKPRSHGLKRISRAKIKTVKLTIVVITCYILCSMPYSCAMLWVAYDTNATNTKFYQSGLFNVLVLIASLNSCVNPWVYLFFNKNLFHALLCCSKNRQDAGYNRRNQPRTSFSESYAPNNTKITIQQTTCEFTAASPPSSSCSSLVVVSLSNHNNQSGTEPVAKETQNCQCEAV